MFQHSNFWIHVKLLIFQVNTTVGCNKCGSGFHNKNMLVGSTQYADRNARGQFVLVCIDFCIKTILQILLINRQVREQCMYVWTNTAAL